MDKQQLSRLLAQSDAMTEQLYSLKNAIINNSLHDKFQNPSSIVVQAINHRQLLREMAQALQSNRKMVQIKKQKIEKTRIVLEGLESYKRTLKEEIAGYHTIVQPIQEYFEEPLGPIDWESNYEEGQAKLKASVEKLKSKDESYKNKINKKNDMIKLINDKNKLYTNVMPKHVKKLLQQVTETIKIFGIQTNQTLQRVQNPKLANMLDIFKTIKVADNIQIVYNKEQYEYIDLIIKPIRLQLYQRALQYNIKLQQKEIKLKISHLYPQFSKLVIGVDRRSDFSNRDLFHRLINRQDIKTVFEQPSNESQRNLNGKFIYVEWIEDILCSSTFRTSEFLLAVRSRVFTVALVKYIFDNVKNSYWLSTINPFLPAQISSKRFSIQGNQKISFQQYKSFINIPSLIKKTLNSYEQQIRKCSQKANSQLQQHLTRSRNKLVQLLSKYCLQQLLIPQIYQYYKVTINYKGLKTQVVIIVPYQYPRLLPKLKVISFERAGQLEQNESIPESIQCRARIDSKNTTNSEIELMEVFLNNSTASQQINQYFCLVNYLNKLFIYIYKAQNQSKKTK